MASSIVVIDSAPFSSLSYRVIYPRIFELSMALRRLISYEMSLNCVGHRVFNYARYITTDEIDKWFHVFDNYSTWPLYVINECVHRLVQFLPYSALFEQEITWIVLKRSRGQDCNGRENDVHSIACTHKVISISTSVEMGFFSLWRCWPAFIV